MVLTRSDTKKGEGVSDITDIAVTGSSLNTETQSSRTDSIVLGKQTDIDLNPKAVGAGNHNKQADKPIEATNMSKDSVNPASKKGEKKKTSQTDNEIT